MTEGVVIRQLPTGVPGLDQVLGGGLPELSFGDAIVSEGARHAEPGVLAVFEKRPGDFSQVVVRAFDGLVRDGSSSRWRRRFGRAFASRSIHHQEQ